jgi:hypothetical protein
MSSSLLKRTWEAGALPRLTLMLGLIVSAGWAIIAGLWTIRFIAEFLQNPALGTAFKIALLVVLPFVALFLVMPLPTQWLMYLLLRLDERRRGASDLTS